MYVLRGVASEQTYSPAEIRAAARSASNSDLAMTTSRGKPARTAQGHRTYKINPLTTVYWYAATREREASIKFSEMSREGLPGESRVGSEGGGGRRGRGRGRWRGRGRGSTEMGASSEVDSVAHREGARRGRPSGEGHGEGEGGNGGERWRGIHALWFV